MLDEIADHFKRSAPAVDYWSLRLIDEWTEGLSVRQDVVQPVENHQSRGAFITVLDGQGAGYAATSDLSAAGLADAAERAHTWAQLTAKAGLLSAEQQARAAESGEYRTEVTTQWDSWSLNDKIDLLREANRRLKISDAIVDWSASLAHTAADKLFVTSAGARIAQSFVYLSPVLRAVANRGAETQRRSHDYNLFYQGGLEHLAKIDLPGQAPQVADEALQLLAAPNCPSGRMDLLAMPGQMILQIHESIGHPLELDRILGDERNFAGSSFVTLDMFGSYRYGSDLLNVTFDPTRNEEFASYGFDDEGSKAERRYLIRNGILQRPLGGRTSQNRANLKGVATSRASGWNRPPVDRMANVNIEPGDDTLEELVASVERGVLMDTNRSWSIDDSRNKFQFGCEIGRLIENGELKGLVKDPNYRGISATFWRSLGMVGNPGTFEIMGVPTCGKGEPNQMIHTGHATPACVFRDVDVFGGV